MQKHTINHVPVIFSRFFNDEAASEVHQALGTASRVLFIDTPATDALVRLVKRLVSEGRTVQIRDHHEPEDILSDRNKERQANVQALRQVLGLYARIVKRSEHPACSTLVHTGEFGVISGYTIVADEDSDGLTAAMKAAGIFYPELDADAAVLDGERASQTEENLSRVAYLLTKGYATVPPFIPKSPEANRKAKESLYHDFIEAASGNAVAYMCLEDRVKEHDAQVAAAEALAETAQEVSPGVFLVDARESARYDIGTLARIVEARGAKVTATMKSFGPIANLHGVQYSMAVAKAFQGDINLQETLPERFVSSPEAGVISNTSFLLHVNESTWTGQVLPALRSMVG